MKAVELKYHGREHVIAMLRTGMSTVQQVMLVEMESQMERAANWSRRHKLVGGHPLHRRTGQLSRSVFGRAMLDGDLVRGQIGATVPYAKVHERGGTWHIRSYQRRPSRTRTPGGRFRKRTAEQQKASITVRAHDAHYPKRAFLRPSLIANRDRIVTGLRRSILRAIAEGRV